MRPAAICALGLVYTLGVSALVLNLRLVSLVIAGAVVLLVAAGFSLRTETISMCSSHKNNEPADSFRVELKNLAVLFLPTFAAVAYCVWLISRWHVSERRPAVYLGAIIIGGVLLLIAGAWFGERLLLWRASAALGAVAVDSAEPRRYRYEFADHKSERHTGTRRRRFWDEAFVPGAAPIFFRQQDPAHSKPGFAFAFHRFAAVERRPLPVRTAEAVHPTG